MSVLFTFPGQGSQRPDMLHTLPAANVVRQTLQEATDVLAQPLSELDSPQALRSTCAVQLALLIAGVASARLLIDAGCMPDMVLGLSIGAWPAAVAAGCLSFEKALPLVRLRGELMEQAYPSGYGTYAVNGLALQEVEALVARETKPEAPVYVANINAPQQIVVAGHQATLERIAHVAVSQYHARKVVPVAISVPSHCVLLDAQAAQMLDALQGVPLQRPWATYVSARTARAIFSPDRIAQDLALNMAHQVHWHDAAVHTCERGARLAVEMLPGSVLSSLCRPVFAEQGGVAVALSEHRVEDLVLLARAHSGRN